MPLGRPNCVQRREVRAFLVEQLNAVVVAVADEHAAARVDRDRVHRAELARPVARAAPLL